MDDQGEDSDSNFNLKLESPEMDLGLDGVWNMEGKRFRSTSSSEIDLGDISGPARLVSRRLTSEDESLEGVTDTSPVGVADYSSMDTAGNCTTRRTAIPIVTF